MEETWKNADPEKIQASSPVSFLEILFYYSYIMYTLNMFVCEILVDICLALFVDSPKMT